MTEATTAPAPTVAVFTDAVLHQAYESTTTASFNSMWIGMSGETSCGESVARHLEATAALLDTDGWVRACSYSADTGASLAVDDSMTAEEMLRALMRFVREETAEEQRRTLSSALRRVGEIGEHGDPDTARVAGGVLDLVVQAYTGVDMARAVSWSERQYRTHADITALLAAGARFARAFGPAASAHGQAGLPAPR